MSNENPPTVLWIKYVFNGELKEVNSAEEDVERIELYAPGVAHVVRKQGVVDTITASEMEVKAKTDQSKIKVPDLVVPS